MNLAGCKSALTTPHAPSPVVYSTDRFKAVVRVLVLPFVALWFILRFVLCLALCCFVVFFSPFSIVITSLGALYTFVRFALVFCFCLFLFLLVFGMGCGL